MPYDWLSTCTCLVLLNVVFTLINAAEEGRYGLQNGRPARTRKYPLASADFRIQRRSSDPSSESYGELKYSRYLTITDTTVKKSNITMGPSIAGEKRTIKIGNQVCGSIRDANEYERTWQRLKGKGTSDVKKVHKCCWSHNRCNKIVPAKDTKYGFKNDLEYDIMACNCDALFKRCLKEENSDIADAIGHVYFDTLKIPCLSFSNDGSHTRRHGLGGHIVSMVPDIQIPSPVIGAAQVKVKSDDVVIPIVRGISKQEKVGNATSLDKAVYY